jgi:hypothetical protein
MVYREDNFPIKGVDSGDIIVLGDRYRLQVGESRVTSIDGFNDFIEFMKLLGLTDVEPRTIFFHDAYERGINSNHMFPEYKTRTERINVLNLLVERYKKVYSGEIKNTRKELSIIDRGGNVFDIVVNRKTVRVYSPFFTIKKNEKCQQSK